jgi:hypothetical protein
MHNRSVIELIPGAAARGMNNSQCTQLIERAEDTLHTTLSILSYLMHQEGLRSQPDAALMAQWQALLEEVTELDHRGLIGADVDTYQCVIETYQEHNRTLNPEGR